LEKKITASSVIAKYCGGVMARWSLVLDVWPVTQSLWRTLGGFLADSCDAR